MTNTAAPLTSPVSTADLDLTIPATCIPDLSVPFDTNIDWPCRRAHFIYMLGVDARNIADTKRTLARSRSPRAVRNLTTWITKAERQLAYLITVTDERPCTCRESGLYG